MNSCSKNIIIVIVNIYCRCGASRLSQDNKLGRYGYVCPSAAAVGGGGGGELWI